MSEVYAQSTTTITCYTCGGKGRMTCMCGGSGVTYTMFGLAPCFACGGAGVLPCFSCGGRGSITVSTPNYTPQVVTPTPSTTPWSSYPVAPSSNSCDSSSTYVSPSSGYTDDSSHNHSHNSTSRPCYTCQQSGRCSGCRGLGTIKAYTFRETKELTCPSCNGSGRCSYCGGDGVR